MGSTALAQATPAHGTGLDGLMAAGLPSQPLLRHAFRGGMGRGGVRYSPSLGFERREHGQAPHPHIHPYEAEQASLSSRDGASVEGTVACTQGLELKAAPHTFTAPLAPSTQHVPGCLTGSKARLSPRFQKPSPALAARDSPAGHRPGRHIPAVPPHHGERALKLGAPEDTRSSPLRTFSSPWEAGLVCAVDSSALHGPRPSPALAQLPEPHPTPEAHGCPPQPPRPTSRARRKQHRIQAIHFYPELWSQRQQYRPRHHHRAAPSNAQPHFKYHYVLEELIKHSTCRQRKAGAAHSRMAQKAQSRSCKGERPTETLGEGLPGPKIHLHAGAR